jgi:Holliday junction resolvasome RuvABC endonuclease subunit
MRILAIDPASILGWAISNEIYGTWDLTTRKDESMGMKLLRLEAKLKEVNAYKIDLIVYERPAGMNTNPIIHQSKLIAIIERFCEENGIQYRGYSATEIKKFGTGNGKSGKPLMIEFAQKRYGYTGNNDNEADALHLLNLAQSEYK